MLVRPSNDLIAVPFVRLVESGKSLHEEHSRTVPTHTAAVFIPIRHADDKHPVRVHRGNRIIDPPDLCHSHILRSLKRRGIAQSEVNNPADGAGL